MRRRQRRRLFSVWGPFPPLVLLFGFLFLEAPALHGQLLRGTVLDEASRAPIPGVTLDLLDTTGNPVLSVFTGEDGSFLFPPLVPGRYRLMGTRLGYRETVGGFVALQAGDTVALEFRMAMEALVLEPITVTASPRPWYEHLKAPALWEYFERKEDLQRLGRGRFLDSEELAGFRGQPLSQAIGSVPGMRVVPDGGQPNRMRVLGRRGCDALFFLNGMQVRLVSPLSVDRDAEGYEGRPPLEFYIDEFVSVSDIEAIEVYRGASELPGEFHGMHGTGNCGAVVVWTKRDVERPRGGGR